MVRIGAQCKNWLLYDLITSDALSQEEVPLQGLECILAEEK
jgi:cAMP phosphodiesterase